jgi:hypothetical protein
MLSISKTAVGTANTRSTGIVDVLTYRKTTVSTESLNMDVRIQAVTTPDHANPEQFQSLLKPSRLDLIKHPF